MYRKIWGGKIANYSGQRITLSQLWCEQGDLKVIKLEHNFYQFVFTKEEENERGLLKRPWFFEN